jgi:ribosomal protein L16 Arg81 hydroxylase
MRLKTANKRRRRPIGVSSARRDSSDASGHPPEKTGGALGQLLAPLSRETFLHEYWEKAPCFVERGDTELFKRFDLPFIQDIDSLISLTHPRPARNEVRLVKTENSLLTDRPVSENADGTADIYSVYRAYNEGFTIIINSVDRRWRQIADLCRGLQASLGHSVGANLYYTPARAQGFLPHFDTHDVFILQLHGSKNWRLFRSAIALPLEDTKIPVQPEDVVAPQAQHRLEVGDLLYIPRGFVHAAGTDDGSSIHLTIGVTVTRWLDLLHDLLDLAGHENVALREALPLNFSSESAGQPLGARLLALVMSLSQPELCAGAVRRRASHMMSAGNPVPDGHFRSLDRVASIDLDTRLARRTRLSCQVSLEDQEAIIRFPGNSVSGPAAIAPALHFVSRAERFAVRDLPNELSDDSKIVLAKRLVREGLITVCDR